MHSLDFKLTGSSLWIGKYHSLPEIIMFNYLRHVRSYFTARKVFKMLNDILE